MNSPTTVDGFSGKNPDNNADVFPFPANGWKTLRPKRIVSIINMVVKCSVAPGWDREKNKYTHKHTEGTKNGMPYSPPLRARARPLSRPSPARVLSPRKPPYSLDFYFVFVPVRRWPSALLVVGRLFPCSSVPHKDDHRMSDEHAMFLMRTLVKIGCEPGAVGMMSTAASPVDPVRPCIPVCYARLPYGKVAF